MAQERDDLVYLAKLAEQAERFDEMVERRRWWLGGLALSKARQKKPKKPQEVYASSSAAAAAATADGFGHARASKFECGSGTLA